MVKPFVTSGLLLVGLVGCAVDQPELGSTAGITFEEFKARTSREPGTGAYIVDWDMVVHGDDALFEFYGARSRERTPPTEAGCSDRDGVRRGPLDIHSISVTRRRSTCSGPWSTAAALGCAHTAW